MGLFYKQEAHFVSTLPVKTLKDRVVAKLTEFIDIKAASNVRSRHALPFNIKVDQATSIGDS